MSDGQAIGALTPRARVRAIAAGSAGNLVEWFDFYVYAFTSLYFSAEFFPDSDPLAQVIATSGIFAVGFLVRPVGAWFFGRFADRHGRRRAMVVSVAMMGVGSLGIACLPTHAQVGALAPALLLAGRLVQGFSTGGEYGAAATYLSEVAEPRRRGFYASFQYVTLIGGQLLAAGLVLLLQALLSAAAMQAWGWRAAFAVGAAAAALALLLRRRMPETTSAAQRGEGAGSLRALGRHWRAILAVLALTAGGSLYFYTFTTYMQKFLVLTTGFDKRTATVVTTAALVPFMAMQPLFGALADRVGRRVNLLLFGGLATVSTVPLLSALSVANSAATALALILAGLAINATYTSISGLFKAELFPVHVRALGVGLSYGVANALFGGSAESVALAFKRAGAEQGFYWYVTAVCAVSLLAAALMRDTRHANALRDIEV